MYSGCGGRMDTRRLDDDRQRAWRAYLRMQARLGAAHHPRRPLAIGLPPGSAQLGGDARASEGVSVVGDEHPVLEVPTLQGRAPFRPPGRSGRLSGGGTGRPAMLRGPLPAYRAGMPMTGRSRPAVSPRAGSVLLSDGRRGRRRGPCPGR
ncbi:hypothetical protein GCM10010466_43230 [Planomonospora alba]|uniref:Uncharacterized protein n=1 Tax=Planomonospora alba TaxID=161354 RepID=A0ABP6NGD9_9ACTN